MISMKIIVKLKNCDGLVFEPKFGGDLGVITRYSSPYGPGETLPFIKVVEEFKKGEDYTHALLCSSEVLYIIYE